MSRGGVREGAGRRFGTPNRRTAELQAAVAEGGETPLQFMLRMMRDDGAEHVLRADMAKSAAPYVHHRLSAIEHTGPEGGPINVNITGDDTGLL